MEPVRIFSTRPVNFKIYAGFQKSIFKIQFQNLNFKIQLVSDRPVRPFFLQKVFVHCSMHLMKNFQKVGMDEVLKFMTPGGGLRKKRTKFLVLLQK